MLLIPICVLIAIFLYHFSTRTFDHWKNKNVKGPKPIPLFGNLINSALRRKHVGIVYKEIYNQFPDEKFVGIYRMTTPTLLIRDLDTVRQILIKDFECFPHRGIEFSKEKLGDNLFHCDGEVWAALKNRFSPVFTSGKLRGMFHTFDEYGEDLVEYIKSNSLKNSEFDAYNLFMKYTIASVMDACFGLKVNTFNDSDLFDLVEKALFTISYKNEMDMLIPGILKKYNISIFPEIINKFCNEVADTVFKHRNDVPSTRFDVMDVMLTLKQNNEVELKKRHSEEKEILKEITNTMIASQVFVFYAAGYGNNTLSLSYAMHYLALHSKIQDKLINEIDEVLNKFDGKLNYDSLNEMKYLDMVFYETLRKHPLTNSISRAVNQDYRLSADVTLNKGTTVVISPYAIHHDEKYYPNPEKFDPERFAPENSNDRHSCAFLTFGAGPRGCLGLRFGRIQFQVALVKLLSHFRVENSRGTKTLNEYNPWKMLLTPQDGIYINFIPRSK